MEEGCAGLFSGLMGSMNYGKLSPSFSIFRGWFFVSLSHFEKSNKIWSWWLTGRVVNGRELK